MPSRAPRICGCGLRVAPGAACPCEARRAREARAGSEAARPSARQRGYSKDWEREAKAFLAIPENRFCACGCGKAATVVDHKIAHRGDRKLFWDRSNWQPMAKGCNSRKAASAEGGFGNPRRAGR